MKFDFSRAENMVPTFRIGVKDQVHIQFPFINDGCCEAVMVQWNPVNNNLFFLENQGNSGT